MRLNTMVLWRIPEEVALAPATYSGVNIYRSGANSESNFDLVTSIPSVSITQYEDVAMPVDRKYCYNYIVRFVFVAGGETTYYLAYTDLSPREKRLGESMRGMLSPFISCQLNDADISAGLAFGMKIFNEVPVQTYWHISDLPNTLEPIVLAISGMFAFLLRYVPIAITDVNYSDNGLSLTIDRGAKVKTAIDTIQAFIDKYIVQMKWNYMEMGSAAGTIPLPLSLGGKMSSSVMNILDIFNVTGR
jgi:hypothetical protein